MKELSVLVPAYNESENLQPLAEEFAKLLKKKRLDAEIIIIDDGSSDSTYLEAKRLANEYKFIRVASHRKNIGKTAALVTGYRISDGEYLAIFDADMQFDPWDVPKMLDKAKEGYDIVTGKKVGKYQKPFISGIYNWFCRKLFKVPVTDLNSMKLFHRDVMKGLPLRDDWHRYLVVLALDQGYTVSEVDVKLSPRLHGKSKYTGIWRMFIGFFDLLAVWFLLTFTRKPMLFFGTLGLFALILAFLVGVFALVLRFGYNTGYRPLLTLITLLAQAGFTLFIFGALAEMIASLREKIDFIHNGKARNVKSKSKVPYKKEKSYSRKSSRSDSQPDKKSNRERKKVDKKRIIEKTSKTESRDRIDKPDKQNKISKTKTQKKKSIEKPQKEKSQKKEKIDYGRTKRRSSTDLEILRKQEKQDEMPQSNAPSYDRENLNYGREPRRSKKQD
ncbi:MAG: glycosyltransferase [Candidatus Zixiibacteriota bacterium]